MSKTCETYSNADYNLGHRLLEQRKEGHFTDITIETKGRCFTAHRLILVADSAFWLAMLKGGFNEENKECVKLPNIDSDVFDVILDYIYTGTLTVTSDSVAAVYESADFLQCKQ